MNDVPLILFAFPAGAGAAMLIFLCLLRRWRAARTEAAIARAAEVQRLQIAFNLSLMANEHLRDEIRIIREAADYQAWVGQQLRKELNQRDEDPADYWKDPPAPDLGGPSQDFP